MNSKIIYCSITAALAGFLFGFDTVVISGAGKTLQNLWHSSDWFHGIVIMSSALWGTLIGSIFGGIPTNKLGRKKTLLLIGILFLVSALGSSLTSNPYIFGFFRLIGGMGIGISTVVAPTYISEISSAKNRGTLVSLYQFNIVLGILIAFLSNYLLKDLGENAWRWMLGIQVIPSVIYLLMIFKIPESPRWLLMYKNDTVSAKNIIKDLNPDSNVDAELQQIQNSENNNTNSESIWNNKYKFPVILAFLIAFFNQLSGINAFLYYAPRIFEEAGLGKGASFLSSIGIGITNLIFTLLGVFFIDKVGRKTLMYIGSVGYIISLSVVAYAFLNHISGNMVPIFLFLFIASHAIGQGAVIWVYIAEIFPNHLRAQGQSFGSSTHWVLAALITLFMPVALSKFDNPGFVFLLFAVMMFFHLIFVRLMMVETKGVSLEDLQKKILK